MLQINRHIYLSWSILSAYVLCGNLGSSFELVRPKGNTIELEYTKRYLQKSNIGLLTRSHGVCCVWIVAFAFPNERITSKGRLPMRSIDRINFHFPWRTHTYTLELAKRKSTHRSLFECVYM